MPWHKIHLTDEEVADDRHGQIMEAVDRFVVKTGFPGKFRILTDDPDPEDDDDLVGDGMNLYFSPELSVELEPILKDLQAVECEISQTQRFSIFYSSGGH